MRRDTTTARGPLAPHVEYAVEIEADAYGVTVMVVRDAHNVPYGIAVAFGDEPAGLGEVLAIWEIEFPGDVSDSPPDDWGRVS